MADLYTPYTWVDGELVTAAQGANRWEQGIESLDSAVDLHGDRLDAVEAALAGASNNTLPVVTSSTRGTPTKGRMVFDDTIGQPIIGNGTAWIQFGAGDVVEGPGSSTAPANFTVTVNPDNSILCQWSAVAGASHYKLYEVRSPDGVDGATELTTTSSLRTPSSMGYYEYWCTAFVDGVESAQSAHGICSLPYGSDPEDPGSGGPAGSPAELLAFGAGGGEWNLGVGYPSGHVDISPSQLESGWSEAPYFYINDAGTKVHFQVRMDGGRTSSNTKYPRCELREYRNGSKASWSGSSGLHVMSGRTTVIHMEDDKPEMVVAQMHDGSDDTLQIRCEGTEWVCNINGETHSTSLGNFSWGTEVAWEIRVDDGTLTIRINGATKITTDPGWGGGQYFKVGVYPQQNSTDQDNPDSGYASCELRDLVVSHS
ncbi:MAG TPA: polysaccharide lyase family 7 protein [Blastococcus sp.]|nr:polysaccharide lyase family 7 protein [Blastococcus sp.]